MYSLKAEFKKYRGENVRMVFCYS